MDDLLTIQGKELGALCVNLVLYELDLLLRQVPEPTLGLQVLSDRLCLCLS